MLTKSAKSAKFAILPLRCNILTDSETHCLRKSFDSLFAMLAINPSESIAVGPNVSFNEVRQRFGSTANFLRPSTSACVILPTLVSRFSQHVLMIRGY